MRCKIFSRTGRTKIPQKAAAVILTLPPGPVRDQSVGNIARQWAQTDARAALDWAQQLPPGDGQRNAVRFALTSWVQTDPAAAAEYMSGLPPGKMQEEATRAVALQLASSDIQSAVTWAQKLPSGPGAAKRADQYYFAMERSRSGSRGGFCLARERSRWTQNFAGKCFAAMGAQRSAGGSALGGKFIGQLCPRYCFSRRDRCRGGIRSGRSREIIDAAVEPRSANQCDRRHHLAMGGKRSAGRQQMGALDSGRQNSPAGF